MAASPEKTKREIEELVKELNYHCYRYYVLDAPVISDEEYDRRYRHLKELEESAQYILSESPTQRVGAPPLDRFKKVKHGEPMLSLDNAFSHDEIREGSEVQAGGDGPRRVSLNDHILMFLLYTLVHDHLDPCFPGFFCCLIVNDTQLHPYHLGPDFDGLIHHRRNPRRV